MTSASEAERIGKEILVQERIVRAAMARIRQLRKDMRALPFKGKPKS